MSGNQKISNMNKFIIKFSVIIMSVFSILSCVSDADSLLKPKVYFESTVKVIEVADQEEIEVELSSRLSKAVNEKTSITYSIGSKELVDDYNHKHGSDYDVYDFSNVSLVESTSQIESGEIVATPVKLKFKGLSAVQEGKSLLLPILVKDSSKPAIDGEDIIYFLLKKPIRIMKVWHVWNNSIKVPILPTTPFKSVTYEALINVSYFDNNNTVMGGEGKLIFRIGDVGGGLDKDLIQIAGNKQFNAPQKLESGRWYHVAFTYDQPTGKARIYINGSKAAESEWSVESFDLSQGAQGFVIGKVAGFMWGERPFHGYMSEVRVWNVSRTENEINQSMLSVDPKSEGLVVYYKLNGEDQYEGENGKWYVKNISGYSASNMDGLSNHGYGAIEYTELKEPLKL